MDLGVAGRAAVVTGASRGIGRATARMLSEAGVSVLLVARGATELEEAASECEAEGSGAGARPATLALDVTRADAAERIMRAAEEQFGKLDIVVNNAGAATSRKIEDVPEEDWYASYEINVMAPKRLMDAAIPAMRERGWGRIVNVASTAGKRPSAYMGEYSVAKAAELSLSRLYADQHAAAGVLVNAVCPGPVKSEMWMAEGGLLDQSVDLQGHSGRAEALEAAGSSRPIGRLAEVDEIAGVIAFLASEQASFVAGVAWGVDGGTVQVII